MSSSTTPFDQAAGLRELFASLPPAAEPALAPTPMTWRHTPTVHALVCPQRPALVLPMAQACAQWWRQNSVPHLWVDELDFDHREAWPLPFKLRYDLAQGLAGHVPLKQTLHPQTQNQGHSPAYYASARRLAHHASEINTPLLSQLQKTHAVLDHLLVSLDPTSRMRPLSVYGAPVRPVILCEASMNAVQDCLDWVNDQPVDSGLDLAEVSLVFYAEQPGSPDRAEALTHWQTSFSAFCGHPPAWTGHVDMAPGAALSSNLPAWQALAGQWLTHLSRT